MTLPPSGIYKITNLANGKVYVGQSENIYRRRKQHFAALRENKHENQSMQVDWNKCSGRYFRWDVIEFCSVGELNEREKFWIDKLDTIKLGYNQGWVPYRRKTKKKNRRRFVGYHHSR